MVLEDTHGNRFTYAHLGSVSSFYPVPKSDGPPGPCRRRQGLVRDDDPAPTAPASAGSQPDTKAQSKGKTSKAPGGSGAERLAAGEGAPVRPSGRPGAKDAGGLEQTLDARARKTGKYETFDAYFSRPFRLDPSKVRLRRLRRARA